MWIPYLLMLYPPALTSDITTDLEFANAYAIFYIQMASVST